MFRHAAYALTACFLLAGCSTYTDRAVAIKDALANEDYAKAMKQTEEINAGTSQLLILYEQGLILHSQGRYEESNVALQAAEDLFDDLYTKSLTREAGAYVISDQVTSYRGEAFETTYVNYYKMLNYWYLGQPDGAMVEVRRLNDKMKFLPDIEDSVYVESPFLQWVTGMMYEGDRDLSNADVSYRRAIESYDAQSEWLKIDPPPMLACDLVHNAHRLGDRELVDRYGPDCGEEPVASMSGGTRSSDTGSTAPGNLTLFLECGYVAGKVSREIVIPIYKDEVGGEGYSDEKFAGVLVNRIGEPRRRTKLDYVLKVALPDLVALPSPYRTATVRAISVERDTLRRDFALAEDLNVWAENAFQVKLPRAMFRAVLRGLVKYSAKKQADKENEAVGFLVNIFNAATEVADTRTWSTLPERIFVGHLNLPEGTWRIEVDVRDGRGSRVAWMNIPELDIVSGERRFLNYRVH